MLSLVRGSLKTSVYYRERARPFAVLLKTPEKLHVTRVWHTSAGNVRAPHAGVAYVPRGGI